MSPNNLYTPLLVKIENVFVETEDKNIKTFSLSFLNEADEAQFQYVPGQFAELTVFGKGEAPLAWHPPHNTRRHRVQREQGGLVTRALHAMEKGAILGGKGTVGKRLSAGNP